MKIHGCQVLSFHIRNADREIYDAVVLVDRGENVIDRYVTGLVAATSALNDDVNEWFWGKYFRHYDDAVFSFLERAKTGLHIERTTPPKYCEGCEATRVTLNHRGYCVRCVDAARQSGNLALVQ